MTDTDKSELEEMGFKWQPHFGHWEISLDDSVPLTILSDKEVKTLLALITQQCNQARIDELNRIEIGGDRIWTLDDEDETAMIISERIAWLQAQVKETEQ